MAFQISKACTNCGACLPKCPTGSISTTPLQYIIDADTCDSHAVCVAACPVNAISPSPSRLALLRTEADPKDTSKKSGGAVSVTKTKESANKPTPPSPPDDVQAGSLESILREYDVE